MGYFQVIFLAAAPISELRGAIPYGIATGVSFEICCALAIATNILIIPCLFIALKYGRFRKLVFSVVGARIKKKIDKHRQHFETWEELALIPFVAVPLPGTGAYTGVLISEFMGFSRIKSGLAIALGVLLAAVIVLLVSFGIFSL